MAQNGSPENRSNPVAEETATARRAPVFRKSEQGAQDTVSRAILVPGLGTVEDEPLEFTPV
jgi:hypothetical protein